MVDTIKIHYKTVKDLELVAFYELPENRRNFDLVIGEEKRFFYDSVNKIELALMNPRRMLEIEKLSSQEVMELFIAWVIASKITHETKSKQQRKKERSMSSIFRRFTNWLGVTKPESVKLPQLVTQERDSTGRFVDPKVETVESKKTSPEVAPAPATATAKKPRAKSPAKPSKPKVVAFDPKAKDGDGDGIVQDGTIHARPSTPKKKGTK